MEACNMMDERATIFSLPNEILGEIIVNLNRNDMKALRLTCKRMDDQVMRHLQFHPELNDRNLNAVLGIQYHFTKIRVTDLTTPRSYFIRGLFKMADSITKLSIHQNVTTGRITSLLNCTRIFQICSNVTDLFFTGTVLSRLPIKLDFFRSIGLPQLKKLTIGFAGVGARGIVFSALSLATFSNLEFLRIWIGSWGQVKLTRMEYSNITRFITGHWQTLKLLEIDDQGNYNYPDFEQIPEPLSTDVLELLGKVQLESLEWFNYSASLIPTTSNWLSAPAFLSGQRNLKNLVLDFLTNDLWDQMKMAIDGSSSTLESFNIRCHPRSGMSFDCTMLNKCDKLKSLFLYQPYRVINLYLLPQSIQDLHWDSSLTLREVWIFQEHLINLKCLRLGDGCGTPSSESICQTIKIPGLKVLRICAVANRIPMVGLVLNAIQNFDPPAIITYFSRYFLVNGVKIITD